MRLDEAVGIMEGRLLTETDGADLGRDAKGGCAADLMSDVLAYLQPGAILLTGLCNPLVVRTAQMADAVAIVFVLGKEPPEETIRLANQEGIPLISSVYGMFELCGRLYERGLPCLEISGEKAACEKKSGNRQGEPHGSRGRT